VPAPVGTFRCQDLTENTSRKPGVRRWGMRIREHAQEANLNLCIRRRENPERRVPRDSCRAILPRT
jgi:hypothetical protein